MARPSVRDKIVQAGVEQFHRVGFNGSSVEDITVLAEVPKGSFYNHFKSKEELAVEVVNRYFERAPNAMLADTAVPPVTRLKRHFAAMSKAFVDSGYKKGCLLGNFSSELADHSPAVRHRVETAFNDWMTLIAKVIAEAQAAGEVESGLKAEQLAGFLLSAFEGSLLRARAAKDPTALKEFATVAFSRLIA